MIGLVILLGIQCLILAVLAFGDIGFDHPGRYGLDFDDMVLLAMAYLAFLAGGVAYAVRLKRWRMIALQLVIPIAAYFAVNVAPRLGSPLTAADYQHLVGKSKSEVRQEIREGRRTSSGYLDKQEFETYGKMTILYSEDGRVAAVEPWPPRGNRTPQQRGIAAGGPPALQAKPVEQKDWPEGLVQVLEKLRGRPGFLDVLFANPDGENPHIDGIYWRMAATEEAIAVHIDVFDLKKADADDAGGHKLLERFPAAFRKPIGKVAWHVWSANRDDPAISAHFWKVMMIDEQEKTLYFFYWVWNVET